jgi:hypothetical protein
MIRGLFTNSLPVSASEEKSMGRTRSQVLGAHVQPRKRAPETRPNLITTLTRSLGSLALRLRPPRYPSQQIRVPANPFGPLPTAPNSAPVPSPPTPDPSHAQPYPKKRIIQPTHEDKPTRHKEPRHHPNPIRTKKVHTHTKNAPPSKQGTEQ